MKETPNLPLKAAIEFVNLTRTSDAPELDHILLLIYLTAYEHIKWHFCSHVECLNPE